MPRIVMMNGPPGCGKDTAVSHLVPYLQFTHLKFAAPIKRMVCGLLNVSMQWLEENKDIPHKALLRETGAIYNTEFETPRQLLIHISEKLLKPLYGKEFFGRIAVNEIQQCANQLILFSDSGFIEEANPVVNKYGWGNCLHLKVFRDGKSFDGDSRSYWTIPKVQQRTINNDTDMHWLTMQCLRAILRQWPDTPLLREPEWIK